MVKLFISTPCYDSMMTMKYTLSLLKLIQYLHSCNIGYLIDFIGNESLIPRARNNSLGKFMNSDCTHLFFIDSDIEFEPESVKRMVTFDKDVVCGCYAKKSHNWKRMIYSMTNEPNSKESIESRALDFAYNAILDSSGNTVKDSKGEFIKAKHASTGFMMIKREILEKLCKKHKELEIITDNLASKDSTICGLFCCMIKNKQYLSEDYSFCERVKDVNGEIWLNVVDNLNHIGKFSFNSDIKNREFLGRRQSERMFYS